MKKVLIIILLQVLFFSAGAQHTKPTKQETMDWIAEKILKYKGNEIYTIKYENNVITFESSSFTSRMIVKLYLDNITSYDYDVNYSEGTNGFGTIGKVIKGNGVVKWFEPSNGKLYLSLNDFSLIHDGFNLSLEAGLLNRMKNALDMLIEFNTKSVEEKF